ncbi:MAG: regulatory protein RecX [Candidatus Dormibacteria bacterium]
MPPRLPPSDPGDLDAAFEKAVRVLNAASQTRARLYAKLIRAGYSAEAAEGACARALALGYVNDGAYARSVVERRVQQGRGRAVISRELAHKGLDGETVFEAMVMVDPETEFASARELASRLNRRHAGVTPERRRQKVLAALARRGFSGGVSRAAFEACERAEPLQ